MEKLKRNKRGITLVALVITIIILLILAGIAISQLTNSGLFNNTQVAKEEYANAQEREEDILKQYENAIVTGEITSDRDTVTISTAEYTRLLNASNIMNYSTGDEKIVGTWVDNTNIYKKTIYIENITKNASGGEIDLNIANVKDIIDYNFTCNQKNKNKTFYVNHAIFPNWLEGSIDISNFTISDNKISMEYYSGYYDLQNCYITIYYTKIANTTQSTE